MTRALSSFVLVLVLVLVLDPVPGAARADEVDDWRTEAAADLEQGEVARAVGLLERVLARRPADLEARFALGVCYFRLGDGRRSRAELEAVLAKEAAHAGALEVLGRLDYSEDRTADAVLRFRAALAADPENARVKELLAKAEKELAVEADFGESYAQHFRLRTDGGALAETPDAAREIQRRVGRLLDEAYDRVGAALGHYPAGETTAILYADRTFYDVTGSHGWVGGLFDGKIRIPVKDIFQRDSEALRRLCYHEYAHACMHSLAPRCPAWLQEGLAQHLEGAPLDLAAVRAGAAAGSLFTFASLEASFLTLKEPERVRLAYAQSHAFVAHLLATDGTAPLLPLLQALGRGLSTAAAFQEAYHRPFAELEDGFRSGLR